MIHRGHSYLISSNILLVAVSLLGSWLFERLLEGAPLIGSRKLSVVKKQTEENCSSDQT